MGRKLILLGKTSLLEQKISVLISLVLAVLTLGVFFLKTLTIDDLSVGQKTAINATVTDDSLITCTTKAIGGDNIGNDESVSNCANSHTIHGKEISYCYLLNDNHWSDNDDGHSDEEDDDAYDDECRENKHEREDV